MTQIILEILGFILALIWKIIIWTWWIFLPLWLWKKVKKYWMYYINIDYLKNVKYKLLELRIPKGSLKTTKAMENIFSTFHATRAFIGSWKDKYLKGKVQLSLSLEIVGVDGEIAFYIRTPAEFQNLIEAQIHAQYPEAEIIESEDYVNLVPQNLPNKAFNIWGMDFGLGKDSGFPLKTYEYFEEASEEKRIVDPLASLVETMSKLKAAQDNLEPFYLFNQPCFLFAPPIL